jgi:ribonuclease E
MLEIERENNESANDGASEQASGQSRGLLRRARRAVTRPAGPPAAEPPAASQAGQSGQGSAAGEPGHASAAGQSGQGSAAGQSGGGSAAGQPARAASAPRKDRAADGGDASAASSGLAGDTSSASSAAASSAAASSAAAGSAAAGSGTEPEKDAAASTGRARSSRSRSAKSGSAPRAGAAATQARGGGSATGAPDETAPDQTAPDQSGAADQPGRQRQAERQPVPPAAFQPPLVIFQPPEISPAPAARQARQPQEQDDVEAGAADGRDEAGAGSASKRRRRGGRGRGKPQPGADGADAEADATDSAGTGGDETSEPDQDESADDTSPAGKRRRRRRRTGSGGDLDSQGEGSADDPPNTVVHVRSPRAAAEADVRSVKGSTRLEAKRQRRREGRESGRRRPPIITESEFLARREAVERVMVVRQHGDRTQIAVLEDGVLVEHYVDKASHQSYVGNVYLGKVQNVLPSMEAAFVDIGKGRNAVLYAGEVNFDASGLEGESKRIESALKSGQSILVQVTKDPIGHKGARLTSQVSLPGRYLVYVPGASMTGISRKLPDTERSRLKQILKQVMPENAGVIVRTAAEGASEEELSRDVARLAAQWEAIEKKSKTANAPDLLYSEPDLTLRVVRDIFNEDFKSLVIASDSEWDLVDEYVRYVAPHLADRMQRWDDDKDVFTAYRVDEQLAKALERKVWLPSGGSLVIDHTEAMTVIDVNTGKFTGQGGNLEQTVTRNNLEAAEEIVRQLRLRDLGGIIVIDFIDMVLESNRELVLRRLLECLARDRTKHQVAEVTSLGLVQMTRKRVGSGLLEAFSVPCEHCNGRGVIMSMEPVDHSHGRARDGDTHGKDGGGRGGKDRNGAAHGGGRGPSARSGQPRSGGGRSADGADGAAEAAAGSEPGDTGDSAATSGRSRGSRSRSRSGSRQPSPAGTHAPADGHDPAGTHAPADGHDPAGTHAPADGHDPADGYAATADGERTLASQEQAGPDGEAKPAASSSRTGRSRSGRGRQEAAEVAESGHSPAEPTRSEAAEEAGLAGS